MWKSTNSIGDHESWGSTYCWSAHQWTHHTQFQRHGRWGRLQVGQLLPVSSKNAKLHLHTKTRRDGIIPVHNTCSNATYLIFLVFFHLFLFFISSSKFETLENLASHVTTAHAIASSTGLYYCRWEKCTRSDRGFNARYKMLVHVRTHTKEVDIQKQNEWE